MTLAEAITIVDREYNAEVRAFTPEQEALSTRRIMSEYDEILDCKDIILDLIGHVHDESDFLRIAITAIRFGMRVQRKLDNPHGVTSILTRTTEVR